MTDLRQATDKLQRIVCAQAVELLRLGGGAAELIPYLRPFVRLQVHPQSILQGLPRGTAAREPVPIPEVGQRKKSALEPALLNGVRAPTEPWVSTCKS